MKRRRAIGQIIPHVVLVLVSICMVLPFILIFTSSVTSEKELLVSGYSFFPGELSLAAYRYIFRNAEVIFRSYGITILLTVVGTITNVAITSMLAYALSLKGLPGRKVFNFLILFAMLFNGGLVPTYLVYTTILHVKDTFFGLLLPGFLMQPMYVILARTYFMTSIPASLYEAAEVDGANKFTVFRHIVLPLGKPIIITVALFAGLGYWNDWTNGLYYITDTRKYGIQNYLYRILQDANFMAQNSVATSVNGSIELPTVSVRMAIAFVAMLPVLVMFPFLEKYFASGIMLGAVKG